MENHFIALILTVLTSLVVVVFITPVIIRYVKSKNIQDRPGIRKVHKEEKPSLGGVAIFSGFLVAAVVFVDFPNLWYNWPILLSLVAVLMVGLLDDLNALPPYVKLAVQIPASLVVIHFGGIRIEGFYGLFGVGELSLVVSYGISLFTFVVVTNAINLIDGLDGLAGTVSLVASLAFGIWFGLVGDYVFSIFCLALGGSLIGFLWYNWEPSKIFMGDTGALFIGFFMAVVAVNFVRVNSQLPADSGYFFNNVATAAICALSIPMFDTLRVFFIRIRQGRSPFSPDQNHVHHILLGLGFGHSGTVLILLLAHLFFLLAAWITKDLSDNFVLPTLSALSFGAMFILSRIVKRRKAALNQPHRDKEAKEKT